MSQEKSLGILGVGHLASYCVAGLRNANDSRRIVLSPRNNEIAHELSHQYNCAVASDNQQVINESDIVMLSVRPDQIESLLADLRFKPGQLIVSVMASVGIDALESLSNLSECQIVRTLPNVSAEVNAGMVPMYPYEAMAYDLLSKLGSVTVLDNETLFNIATVHGVMQGWVYYWLEEMMQWTKAQGIEDATAKQMILDTVQGAIALSQHQEGSLKPLADHIAKPGTFTKYGYDYLAERQAVEIWSGAMQHSLKKLTS